MTQSPLYSRIIGTGSAVPPDCVTNQELAGRLAARGIETSDEWIATRTGIRQRYFAAPEAMTSDLALTASKNALRAADLAQHGLCAPTQTGITQPLHRIRSASRVYRFCVCTHDCRSIHSRSRMPDCAGRRR